MESMVTLLPGQSSTRLYFQEKALHHGAEGIDGNESMERKNGDSSRFRESESEA